MIEIQGADQLARLAKQLREAGAKDLQRELGQAINRATKPVKADIKRSFAEMLPHRGGLAKRAAATKLTTRRRTSAKTAGVRIVAKGTLSLYHLNQGQIRHRKDGNINAGKVQPITPGVWTKPAEAAAPKAREEIVKSMDAVAAKIVRGV
jgi:retron-type reverse transcriptase